jgi:hypothetical protein
LSILFFLEDPLMISAVPAQKLTGFKKFALVGTLAVSVMGMDSDVLKPQKVDAAPFMANSLAALETAFAGNEMLTKGIAMLSAVCYWIPVIALLVGVGAGAASRDAQSGEGFKTVIGIVVAAWLVLGVMWVYDTNGVPEGSTQRPTRAEVPHFIIATIARG